MPIDPLSPQGLQLTSPEAEAAFSGATRSASDVAGVFSPTSKLVNGIGSALHLPDPVKQIAKLGLAFATGDIAGIVSAALGLLSGAAAEAAQTRYHTSPSSPAPAGYAPSQRAPTATPSQTSDLRRQRQALQTLARHFGAIDNAAGLWFRDGRFGGFDMNAVTRGPYPPELKDAVGYLRSHPDQLIALDARDGLDGLVSLQSVEDALLRVDAQLATPRSDAPSGRGTTPSTAVPPPGSGSGGGRPSMTPLEAAQRAVETAEQRAMEDPDDKQKQLDLQKATQRLEALFSMLTNLSRAHHQMAMAAIGNLAR